MCSCPRYGRVFIRRYRPDDARDIVDIYNHYILNTTVTFEQEPVTEEDMSVRLWDISERYQCFVVYMMPGSTHFSFRTGNEIYGGPDGMIAGYCYAHPWKQFSAYGRTLETTIYIRDGMTSCGLGDWLMRELIHECRSRGYHALIACITAENEGSIRFHESLGFVPVSHYREVGHKFGRYLDVVDMQLLLGDQ